MLSGSSPLLAAHMKKKKKEAWTGFAGSSCVNKFQMDWDEVPDGLLPGQRRVQFFFLDFIPTCFLPLRSASSNGLS